MFSNKNVRLSLMVLCLLAALAGECYAKSAAPRYSDVVLSIKSSLLEKNGTNPEEYRICVKDWQVESTLHACTDPGQKNYDIKGFIKALFGAEAEMNFDNDQGNLIIGVYATDEELLAGKTILRSRGSELLDYQSNHSDLVDSILWIQKDLLRNGFICSTYPSDIPTLKNGKCDLEGEKRRWMAPKTLIKRLFGPMAEIVNVTTKYKKTLWNVKTSSAGKVRSDALFKRWETEYLKAKSEGEDNTTPGLLVFGIFIFILATFAFQMGGRSLFSLRDRGGSGLEPIDNILDQAPIGRTIHRTETGNTNGSNDAVGPFRTANVKTPTAKVEKTIVETPKKRVRNYKARKLSL